MVMTDKTAPESDRALISELHDVCTAIAADAAALVAERRATIGSIDTKSSSTDVVTDVDRAAEELIVERILAARPDDGIVGEEGTGVVGTSGIEWVVDPIDGTTSFVYGYPGYSVSIAAARHTGGTGLGEILAGAVADPVHDHLYAAGLGMGATRNGESLSATDQTNLAASLIATGFSYDAERRGAQAEVLTHLLPEVRDIRRSGSAAMDLCFVAAGHVDAYFEVGLNAWDLAAGLLIATEAGATCLAEFGAPATFTVASAPGIATALFGRLDDLNARLLPAD